MGPNIRSVDQRNRATPLANDYLKILQGQLDQGAFGTGVGPLQKQAGKGAQQYLIARQNAPQTNTAAQVGDYTNQLIDAVSRRSNVNTNRQAQDLREGFGIAGGRYGTSLARGEGLLRSESGMNLDSIIANILTAQGDRQQGARQFDVGANQAGNNQLLQAIMALQGMGNENLNPFNAFASQGIINPETIVSPGIGSQLLQGAMNIGAAYLGRAPGINPGAGGTGPTTRTGGGFVGQPTTYPGTYTSGMPVVDPRIFDQGYRP